jgi:energy-coupling factor transporter ATP-binding protein EcfA2
MTLPPNQLGLVFGRSGAGKTTLLQLVAGLAQQTSGGISFSGPPPPLPPGLAGQGGTSSARAAAQQAAAAAASGGLSSQERMAAAGLVFQVPERHFIGNTLSAELTAGWPVAAEQFALRQALAVRTQEVMAAVGLQGLPLDAPLANLSDGYKR